MAPPHRLRQLLGAIAAATLASLTLNTAPAAPESTPDRQEKADSVALMRAL